MKQTTPYKILLMALGLLLCGGARAQTSFVQDDIVKIAGITADTQINVLSAAQKQTLRTYYDGLGRPLQAVAENASPLHNDLIQPVAYDNLGRQTVSYLPYADESGGTTGSYRSNALTSGQPGFYNQTGQYLVPVDNAPYSQSVIESSPLQRTLSAGMTGNGFQAGVSGNHYKTVNYRPNSSADGNILQWNPDGSYTTGSYYTANSLSVTDGKNEDGVETLVFTDFADRTILKRQILSSGNLDTYYIYNNAGMLAFIVPPLATNALSANGYNLSAAPLVNLVYNYTYDNMGRMTQERIPSKGVVSIIYDPLNRPVLSQDANMAAKHQWNFVKYDVKGRPVMSGLYTDATHTTPAAMQSYVTGLASAYNTVWYESRTTVTTYHSYTNNVFPTSGTTPLAYNFYDNYDITGDGAYDYSYKAPSGLTGPPVACSDSLRNVPTITQKAAVGPSLSGLWLTTVTFYDHYGHPIQTRSNNQLYYVSATTLTDTATTVPDFTGKTLQTKVTKVTGTTAGTTNSVTTTLNYDSYNLRLASVDQVYNAQAKKRIAAYVYNESGQVILKRLDSLNGAWLQNLDYRYNIRGQLLSINNSKLSSDTGKTNNDTNDLFGMQIMYDKPDTYLGTVTASYSGRISAVKWMTRDGSNNKTNERSYVYNYDQLGRDTSAWYAERSTASLSAFNINNHGFDEYGITYDAGGNIKTLKRTSSSLNASSHTLADNLVYTYDTALPDRLDNVADNSGNTALGFRNMTGSTGNYTYDSDGNLTGDPYKGLNLLYNTAVNRVDSIMTTQASMNGAYITYTYDAAGGVLRKQVYSTSTSLQSQTDYIGGFVYTTASGATTLTYIQNTEGRLMNTTGSTVTLTPEYVITDNQGNARFSFQDNGTGIVIRQENSYYSFGEVLANSPVATPTTSNINLYNGGSEWQNEFSNLPDYHQTFFRNYDPVIGRFIAVDPKPESAESMTVYQYAGNDPFNNNDPGGDKLAQPQAYQYMAYYSQLASTEGNPDMNLSNSFLQQFAPQGGASGSTGGTYSAFWDAALSYLTDMSTALSGASFNLTGSELIQGAAEENASDNPQLLGALANGNNFSYSNGSFSYWTHAASSDNYGIVDTKHTVSFSALENSNPDKINTKYGTFEPKFSINSNAHMDIFFFPKPDNGFKEYKWIQTVYSAPNRVVTPWVDGVHDKHDNNLDYPFYWESGSKNGAYFGDDPHGNWVFLATVTLIGIDNGGHEHALGSFEWGYYATPTPTHDSNIDPIFPNGYIQVPTPSNLTHLLH